jgi:GNAT superfamily N-acetyltransferase
MIEATFPVMRQLRPHLENPTQYRQQVEAMQQAHGFRLVALWEGDVCLGVTGFTVETRLYAGKMLYVADLVTDEKRRSQGSGQRLLHWLENEAKRQRCSNVILDSGTHRTGAHRFYFREGFHIACYNFRKVLL